MNTIAKHFVNYENNSRKYEYGKDLPNQGSNVIAILPGLPLIKMSHDPKSSRGN